jgi:hypothetical protein
MESPKANGRYIIHGDTVNMKEVTDAIRKKFPNHRIASVPLTGSKMTAFIKFLFWLYPSGITDYVRTSMGKCSFCLFLPSNWSPATYIVSPIIYRPAIRDDKGRRRLWNDVHGHVNEFMWFVAPFTEDLFEGKSLAPGAQ